MSKNYLCKDCKDNNNGWCSSRKIQGLKNITNCPYFNNKNIVIEEDEKLDCSKYKQFGKREMFFTIQRQMLAIDQKHLIEDKYNTLKQTMVELEKLLQAEEGIHGIALDYSIDRDIYNNSKLISDTWSNEIK
jgi:hypothetical protein